MSSKTSPPYIPTYPKDELATVALLDLEVVGVYYRLKWHLWINGGKAQNDEKILCRMAGIHVNKWRKLLPKLQGEIVEYDDGTISLVGVWAINGAPISRRSIAGAVPWRRSWTKPIAPGKAR